MQIVTRSEAETERLGARLGKRLFPGAFIALYGRMGAGKTAFARGVGAGLGVDAIQSPTYTIVMEHAGRIPLLHFDAYRVSGGWELDEIGFDDYLASGAAILMEWADRAAGILPGERLDIRIDAEEGLRRFTFAASGEAHSRLIAGVSDDADAFC